MNKEKNQQQRGSYPFKKILLFGEIAFVGFVALILHFMIMIMVGPNYFFLTTYICLLGWLPAMAVGFVIFLLILKTKYEKFITIKSSTIFSFILALIIIIHAVSFYYERSPPSDVVDTWFPEEGQLLCVNLSNSCSAFEIQYREYHDSKEGYIDFITSNYSGSFDFEWDFDKFSNVITIFYNNNSRYAIAFPHNPDLDFEWEVKLRLEITDEGKLITYYISEVNTPFDAKLLDGVTWFSY